MLIKIEGLYDELSTIDYGDVGLPTMSDSYNDENYSVDESDENCYYIDDISEDDLSDFVVESFNIEYDFPDEEIDKLKSILIARYDNSKPLNITNSNAFIEYNCKSVYDDIKNKMGAYSFDLSFFTDIIIDDVKKYINIRPTLRLKEGDNVLAEECQEYRQYLLYYEFKKNEGWGICARNGYVLLSNVLYKSPSLLFRGNCINYEKNRYSYVYKNIDSRKYGLISLVELYEWDFINGGTTDKLKKIEFCETGSVEYNSIERFKNYYIANKYGTWNIILNAQGVELSRSYGLIKQINNYFICSNNGDSYDLLFFNERKSLLDKQDVKILLSGFNCYRTGNDCIIAFWNYYKDDEDYGKGECFYDLRKAIILRQDQSLIKQNDGNSISLENINLNNLQSIENKSRSEEIILKGDVYTFYIEKNFFMVQKINNEDSFIYSYFINTKGTDDYLEFIDEDENEEDNKFEKVPWYDKYMNEDKVLIKCLHFDPYSIKTVIAANEYFLLNKYKEVDEYLNDWIYKSEAIFYRDGNYIGISNGVNDFVSIRDKYSAVSKKYYNGYLILIKVINGPELYGKLSENDYCNINYADIKLEFFGLKINGIITKIEKLDNKKIKTNNIDWFPESFALRFGCEKNDEPLFGLGMFDQDSYEKYGGYNGYNDDAIDSAFEGDPLNTWNVE